MLTNNKLILNMLQTYLQSSFSTFLGVIVRSFCNDFCSRKKDQTRDDLVFLTLA